MTLNSRLATQSSYRRMDFLSRIPALADIEKLQQESQQYFNQTVQLPWIVGEPPCGYFLLASYSGSPDNVPKWALYCEDGKSRELKWVYETYDTSLLHNMLLCAFADEDLSPENHNTYAFSSTQNRREALPLSSSTKSQAATQGLSTPQGTVQNVPQISAIEVYERHLLQIGVDEKTVLQIVPMTAEDYLRCTADAIPVDTALQFQMGRLMDGKNTIADIVQALAIGKDKWVPVIYNVLRCGLAQRCLVAASPAPGAAGTLETAASFASETAAAIVKTTSPATIGPEKSEPESAGGEARTVEALKRQIYNAQTGILSYPAFQMFLNKELQRHEVYERPFAVLIMRHETETNQSVFDIARQGGPLLTRLQVIISHLKRSDYLCHYGRNGLAVILPEVSRASALSLMKDLARALVEFRPPVPAAGSSHRIKLGVAAVPEDGESASTILLTAMESEPVLIELG